MNAGSLKISVSNNEDLKFEKSGGIGLEVAGFGLEYEGTESLGTKEGVREFTDTYELSIPSTTFGETTTSVTDDDLVDIKPKKKESYTKIFTTSKGSGVGVALEGEASLKLEPLGSTNKPSNYTDLMVAQNDATSTNYIIPIKLK